MLLRPLGATSNFFFDRKMLHVVRHSLILAYRLGILWSFFFRQGKRAASGECTLWAGCLVIFYADRSNRSKIIQIDFEFRIILRCGRGAIGLPFQRIVPPADLDPKPWFHASRFQPEM